MIEDKIRKALEMIRDPYPFRQKGQKTIEELLDSALAELEQKGEVKIREMIKCNKCGYEASSPYWPRDNNGWVCPNCTNRFPEQQKPVCETCGGSGVVGEPDELGGDICTNSPCPSCAVKTEAGEFVQKNKMRINRDMAILQNPNNHNESAFRCIGTEALEHLQQACTLISQQAEQIKELQRNKYPNLCEELNAQKYELLEQIASLKDLLQHVLMMSCIPKELGLEIKQALKENK